MTQTLFDYANYYCKSLEDANLVQGTFELDDLQSWQEISSVGIQQGRVNAALLQEFLQSTRDHYSDLEIIIRPILFELPPSHERIKGVHYPQYLSPIITIAKLKPNGRIYPIRSFIAADLFEPAHQKIYTIGAKKDLDHFIKSRERNSSCTFAVQHKEHHETTQDDNGQWTRYIQSCDEALKAVCGNWMHYQNTYTKLSHGLVSTRLHLHSKTNPIEALYHHILNNQVSALPLLQDFVTSTTPQREKELPPYAHFTKKLASTDEGLSHTPTQSRALAHIATLEDGKMLAINTPPCTGKSTLIKSAIANLWTLAAATSENAPPPISIVVSNHAKSLKKIATSFGERFLSTTSLFDGRWLPPALTATSKDFSTEQSLYSGPQYARQADAIFAPFETFSYYEHAKENFMVNAQLNLPQIKTNTVEQVVQHLQEKIQTRVEQLNSLENAWEKMAEVNQKLDSIYGNVPKEISAKDQEKLDSLSLEKQKLIDFSTSWKSYLNEGNMFTSLLTLLPSKSEKQFKEAIFFLKQNAPVDLTFDHCKNLVELNHTVSKYIEDKNKEVDVEEERIEELQQLINHEKIHSIDWAEAIVNLSVEADFRKVKNLSEAEVAADQSIRFDTFQLATHYWEGRWLLEIEKMLAAPETYQNPNDKEAILKKWRMRMMLVPCMGATFNELPNIFKSGDESNPQFLYNAIDLLLVDHAEQVRPDEAAASFSLAKKAIVMGDIQQIDSISFLNRYMDRSNLQEFDLASSTSPEQDYLKLSSLGKTASLGNVMRLAQTRSPYHQITELSAGLYLTEQACSFDELVHFSNLLCYQDALTPKRGRKIEVAMQEKRMLDELPPIAYAHVDGYATQTIRGSYKNECEAEAIADWLKRRQKSFESHYQKKLADIVSIVAPYSSQAEAIIQACRAVGIDARHLDDEGLSVHTAYSLQNLSSPIVIFSNTYSKHLSFTPITHDTKLFNSAISNAHDAFVIFADIDMLENTLANSPRGMLKQILFEQESSIAIPPQLRSDLLGLSNTSTPVKTLDTIQEHTLFFKETLQESTQNIVIACPALELYDLNYAAIQQLKLAIQRGASIQVYTDTPTLLPFHDEAVTKSSQLDKVIQTFKQINIPVHLVSRIHRPFLICDKNIYCTGFYNWLSANYIAHTNAPQTLVYHHHTLAKEIEIQKKWLKNKIVHL